MAGKRKDNQGRILKEGESQRANGTYMYRYQTNGKRRYIYAKTLNELREKEAAEGKELALGLSKAEGDITIETLMSRLMQVKRNLKISSLQSYEALQRKVLSTGIGSCKAKDFKSYDAKMWCIQLEQSGAGFCYVESLKLFLGSAFAFGVENDWVLKNPFSFPLTSVLKESRPQRVGLTPTQQEVYLRVAKEQLKPYWYSQIVVLLGTGMRVGELNALTFQDINLGERYIHVNKNVFTDNHRVRHIQSPKTKAGDRKIPISNDVLKAILEIYDTRNQQKVEKLVDGYIGFIFINRAGNIQSDLNLGSVMRRLQPKFEAALPGVPKVTPHVLRHTFCSNLIAAGVDPKSVQYIMGHARIDETLNIYAHSSFEAAQKAFYAAIS